MSKTYVSAALRRLVYERANQACEYCLIPEVVAFISHEVDHIIAEKHGGKTEESNLALACAICNKNKGSDVASVDPQTQQIIRLYHPRCDRWRDHFQFDDGQIIPLTPIGRVTGQLLQLNRGERLEERRLLNKLGILKVPAD